MRRVVGSILGTGLLLSSSLLFGAKHPVPLDKGTSTEKCIECHEDKSKGKAVHSAIATGCTSCHEIRVAKDVTRVKLITTTPQALCITCHADKNAAEIKGKVHSPAVRDCIECHSPHSSDNKNQLLKPTSGADAKENLCLACHKIGVDVPKDGSRHAALDMGCDTCHVTHKSGEPGKREFDFHLTKATPQLCLDCHDVKDAAIVSAHNGQPFATADCMTCHDPHQSASKKLMQKFTHAPFGDKDSCSTCHAAPKDGKVVLTQADSKALCVSCHDEQAKKIEGAKVQHPGAQGDCITCHNPHAGKTPGFLQPDPVSACTSCHADQAEQHKKKHLHQPAFEQGCATCHEPHGGDHAKLLRAEGNKLCLECHGNASKPAKLEDAHLVTIFDGKVRLPEDYFRSKQVARFDIKSGLGHPTTNHPVEDVRDPNDPAKIKTQVSCLSCHQSHASKERAMLVNDSRPGMQFCSNCHKGMIGAQ